MRRFVVLTVGLVAALYARPQYGQSSASILVQGTLGASTSAGGLYNGRGEIAREIMLGARLPTKKVPLILGIALGQPFVLGDDTVCEPHPDGGCLQSMPRFGYFALLAGVEAHGRAGEIGVMAGPALLAEDGSGMLTSRGSARTSRQVGAQLRMDFASPSLFHVALVASPRLLVVPHFEGATFTLRSFNLGVRLR